VNKTLVINAVGLTPDLIGEHTPRLKAFRDAGKLAAIGPVVPAVTTTVQTTYLTGVTPAEHGIVGNGWYFRDESEIHFWKQSDKLVQRPRVWERARQIDPKFTCANVCWWYAMYSSADFTVTPRPMYPADGRKLPDCWTFPSELRDELQMELGQFPLFKFWGPATDISATKWIADAAVTIDKWHSPTLSLVYLPHLDYCLQRRGPGDPANAKDLAELDAVCGTLIDRFNSRDARIMILSEYGVVPVDRAIHPNRLLRQNGLLSIRDEAGHDMIDPGASAAFAVADHQVAHVYVNDRSQLQFVAELFQKTPGIGRVLDEGGKAELGLNHPRAGDLVLLASPDSWFTYYFWLDDKRAPDYARTVDIHRKPGYDPVELFLDPAIKRPTVKIGTTLLKRKLGFRAMMDVIPLNAGLVRGSHGLAASGAMVMTDAAGLLPGGQIAATGIHDLILQHLF
jgi:predicted AlkP superfamily pyrophosphatase or phosphodiesterase